MQRRDAIARLSSLAALPALAFGGLGTGAAAAAPARASDFAANLRNEPLLAPFAGVDDTSGTRDAAPGEILHRGRWPEALAGRFYRNGPALFERDGERYHHWFDGDGMVQQFTLAGGRVRHRGRLVRTAKLEAERRAGRFLVGGFGTEIRGRTPATGNDSFNTANTSAIEHAGRVLAMWEGGSAHALDPADLRTTGPVAWRAELQGVPFSAHPKLDPQGHLWNIGTFGNRIVAWHVGPDGGLVRAQLGELPVRNTLVHDMAITRRWIVVPLPPIRLDFDQRPEGPRRFGLTPGEPLRVLVMDKDDITQRRVFELPPQAVFHVGNAHERGDGRIELSLVGAPDAGFLDQGAVALMAGRRMDVRPSTLQLLVLDMASGRVETRGFEGNCEFPRVHPARVGLASRWTVAAGSWGAGRSHTLLHGVVLFDAETGRTRRHDYGEHVVAEEHVFVPKPRANLSSRGQGELDAWLLGTTYDSRRRATVLNLLDAAHLEDGPVATAALPYTLPLGFHGHFTPA